MQLHQLKPNHKKKTRKRVGRGGKRGTYSGRGMKGQRARAGARTRPALRDLIESIPKLRGARSKQRGKASAATVRLSIVERKFESGDTVSPRSLLEKGLVRRIKGRAPRVKILGPGEVTKKLTIKDCEVSKGAQEAIEKAGGSVSAEAPKETRSISPPRKLSLGPRPRSSST